MTRKAAQTKAKPLTRPASAEGPHRFAAALDPSAKAANILQIRRARGQVEGIERMIESDRYCADIIVQITAVRASLQAVAKALLESHLKACHTAAMSNGGAEADKMYQELMALVSKMTK
jgi:DNA-binding FrmR family transcriptional regulator